ncbi:hypothetical protein [Tardiphaga sp. OK245]|jgi:hypothetical protein|uniref:hypothetical protein n=1 Tax=Tardiphaga sp. OK245 TaxID=1855306 RepID=UPI0008A778F8|nr:hypothetical protein [Tardiphaga sp. OK245]SEH87159.1 hypothetical protein SAMN05216367_2458 [Tardiphaga sp. OK245]
MAKDRKNHQTTTRKTRTAKKATVGKTASPDDLAATSARKLTTVLSDVALLNNDEITEVIHHCAAALRRRKPSTAKRTDAKQASAQGCYTWAGDTKWVTVWSGGEIVKKMLKSEADQQGIKPCG